MSESPSFPENPTGPQVRAMAAYFAALTISGSHDRVYDNALERRTQFLADFITGPQDEIGRPA